MCGGLAGILRLASDRDQVLRVPEGPGAEQESAIYRDHQTGIPARTHEQGDGAMGKNEHVPDQEPEVVEFGEVPVADLEQVSGGGKGMVDSDTPPMRERIGFGQFL